MEVESLAFKYVEMVLTSLLAKKPIPTVGPGEVVKLKDPAQMAMCISAENEEGKCEVSLGRGRRLMVDRASIMTREDEIARANGKNCNGDGGRANGSCKNSCGDNGGCANSSDACATRSKEAAAKALEASAEKVTQACLSVRDGADMPADHLKALQVQMTAAKADFKAILADSKQILQGDERLSKLSLNGPCSNDLCMCAICECGVACRCNIADVKDEDTCEKCVDFRAKKKTAAAAAANAAAGYSA